ncbi:MAG: thiamine-phosphate kinase [Elusimicrobiota bacterium]|jgi:thiamine-monophosphate kinase|nr:thiamine-phosphate kinase [Elusimicrobiota bacterium]
MNTSISSIDEFALIDEIKKIFAKPKKNKIITANIGDDCFCFKIGTKNICITKDVLVENVHFKKNWTTPFELGQKAIEVNISDIAAMGNVTPKYVFIGLCLPKKTPHHFFHELYKGLKKSCDKYKAIIAGGDTVKSDKLTISVTVVGVAKGNIIKRSGAENGDLIGVTNTFGDAAAGVALLCKYGQKHIYNAYQKNLIAKQNAPQARLKIAQKISNHITALTDASDGLWSAVDLIAKSSMKGAKIFVDTIAISQNLRKVFKEKKLQQNFALFGGEDYELVFSVSKSKAQFLKKIAPEISYIGEINNSNNITVIENGKEQNSKYKGFKHF